MPSSKMHSEHIEMKAELPKPSEGHTQLLKHIDELELDLRVTLPGELIAGRWDPYARLSLCEARDTYQDAEGRTLPQHVALLRKHGWEAAIGYPMRRLVQRPDDGEGSFFIPDPGVIGLYAQCPHMQAPRSVFRESVLEVLRSNFPNHARDLDEDDLAPQHVLVAEFPVLNDAGPTPAFYKTWAISKELRRQYAVVLTVSPNGRTVQVWRSQEPVEPFSVPDGPEAQGLHKTT